MEPPGQMATEMSSNEVRIKRPGIHVAPMDSGDDSAHFLYTEGMSRIHPSRVEFIVLNVARDDVRDVGALFDFLAGRLLDGHDVRPYQNAESRDVSYAILPLDEDDERALVENYATALRDRGGEDARLLLLAPHESLPLALPPGVRGSGRRVIGERAVMINSIKEKWCGLGLIRHIDGNTLNNYYANLTYVSFYDAFTHPEWRVDWVCYLEEEEIAFVRNNMAIFAEIYKPS